MVGTRTLRVSIEFLVSKLTISSCSLKCLPNILLGSYTACSILRVERCQLRAEHVEAANDVLDCNTSTNISLQNLLEGLLVDFQAGDSAQRHKLFLAVFQFSDSTEWRADPELSFFDIATKNDGVS